MRLTLSRYRFRNTFIAAGLAILGALLVLLYVSSYRDDVQSGAELVEVFVAARDIPEGTDGPSVAGSYLRKETVLKRNVVRGAITGPAQIADLAASQTILEGEQVTTRQFHPLAEQGVLASISGNRRAMTVPGDGDTLLAGIVNDGDRVDVLANVNYIIRQSSGTVSRGDLRRVASRVILRDLLVLRAPSGSGDAIAGDEQSSITLAVTDRQAQKLLWAIENGSFWLVLRPVSRPADSAESVETLESILADGLGPRGIEKLTSGYGAGSIGSGG
jgi:Flp pilus assembly protein CpaB